MVPRDARTTPPAEKPPQALRELFDAWRRLLTVIARRVGHWARIVGSLVFPSALEPLPERSTTLLGVGCATLGIGLTAWTVTATSTGTPFVSAVAVALVGAAWVVARWPIMRVAAHADTSPTAIARAWAAGTLPWAFAATPVLRIAAWALGLFLAVRALEASGVAHRDAWYIASCGFGFELVGLLVVWLARNATAAALLLS